MHYFSDKPGNFFSSVVSGKSLNLSEFSALPLPHQLGISENCNENQISQWKQTDMQPHESSYKCYYTWQQCRRQYV